MKTAVAILLTAATVCGCGSDTRADSQPTAPLPTSSSPSPSASPSPSPSPSASPSPTPEPTVDPAFEQNFVADITANNFATSRETLSAELVKDSTLVEAQDDFRFDRPSRTLIIAVTSVFDGDASEYRQELAYDLASNLAPVYWGPEVTNSVRPESTVLLGVTVDELSYTCPGPVMVSLARRELSQERFLQECV